MKKTTQLFAGLLMLTGVLSACSPAGNEGFMRRVETDFRHKQELLPRGDLFGIFDEPMTPQERDAMTFLYAYMPVGDITDYLGDFYLENVRCALSVRQEMPWGRSVSGISCCPCGSTTSVSMIRAGYFTMNSNPASRGCRCMTPSSK